MLEGNQLKLCSSMSRELIMNFKENKFTTKVEAGKALFGFFGLYKDENEFWDLLNMLVNKHEISPENKIRHVNDIVKAYYSKIEQLETAGPFSYLGTALAKKDDRLMECARMYLKLGDIKQYCEIMFTLGQWEKGIALAPCVSITYWKESVNRYKDVLKKNSGDNLLEYELLANDEKSAMDNLIEREEYEDAKLVKIQFENDIFNDVTKNYEISNTKKIHPLNANIETITPEAKNSIMEIFHTESEFYFSKGEIMLSVATEFAAGNINAGIIKLIRANELLLAYYTAKILNSPVLDQISYLLALKAEKCNDLGLPVYFYQCNRNPRYVRLFGAKKQLDLNKFGMKPIGDCAKLAKDSNGVDAVYYYLLSGNQEEAAKITIEKTKNSIKNKKLELFEEVLEMNGIFQTIEAYELNRDTKVDLLYYSSFIGFFKAMWLGFYHVIIILITNCSNIENFTQVPQGIDLKPFIELGNKVVSGIFFSGKNNLEYLIEEMNDPNAKLLAKGIFKAIRKYYSSGTNNNNHRISFIWGTGSILLQSYGVTIANQL